MADEPSTLYEQPTSKPTRKVGAAGIAGSLATLLIFLLGRYGVELSGEEAAAITTIIMFALGYFIKDRDQE